MGTEPGRGVRVVKFVQFSYLSMPLCSIVLAKQAEKKAILEKIEQGKRAKKNNKKRPHPGQGNDNSEPLLKRPKSKGDLISNTPSPMTMNSSRPASVLSSTSTADPVNGGEGILEPQGAGSTDGSEANTELAAAAGGPGSTPGSTPGRKPATSRLQGGVVKKRTSAPLGGRGKMQKSGKKSGRSAAAASAGAIAGAKAATNAAFAAYGLPPHHISPSPGSSAVSGSTHSSPRVSPVPMAFVATSLVTTPPSNKLSSSKAPSSLTYAQK